MDGVAYPYARARPYNRSKCRDGPCRSFYPTQRIALFSQELHADLIRQERLRLRVAMLEDADRAMPITSESINVDSTNSLPNTHDSTFSAIIPGPAQMTSGRPDPSASRTDHKAMPEPAFPSPGAQLNDEPEAWTPQVSRRRSK